MHALRIQADASAVASLRAIVLSGREAILPYASLLEQLAERFGQYGAMGWLEYFLSGDSIRFKSPWLVLLVVPGAPLDELRTESIAGCVLFSEYVFGGIRTRAVTTEDLSGFRTVLAAKEDRAQVAERCAAELLIRGAHIVLTTYAGQAGADQVPATNVAATWAARRRLLGSHLELCPTYAETLARFNRTVRFRLGYFRRRLLLSTPCTFVQDVTTEITEGQFLALNRGSLNPVPDEEASRRWNACRLPGGYALGLRTDAGQWLGIIGGWRQENTTVLHWQLNSAGWEKHSLTTVLRSYFLEYETERKTQNIVFYGGTPHSIRHYFIDINVTDLVFRRSTMYARLLHKMAVGYATKLGNAHRPNFLADTLGDETLHWTPTVKLPAEGTSDVFQDTTGRHATVKP
jgi:hypothetical protein